MVNEYLKFYLLYQYYFGTHDKDKIKFNNRGIFKIIYYYANKA